MNISEPDLGFNKFLVWFGNVRDSVEVNIEKLQDDFALHGKYDDFPFTEEEIECWQRCGLISISEVYLKEFTPHQKIKLRYNIDYRISV